jgi:hypothetical protein
VIRSPFASTIVTDKSWSHARPSQGVRKPYPPPATQTQHKGIRHQVRQSSGYEKWTRSCRLSSLLTQNVAAHSYVWTRARHRSHRSASLPVHFIIQLTQPHAALQARVVEQLLLFAIATN